MYENDPSAIEKIKNVARDSIPNVDDFDVADTVRRLAGLSSIDEVDPSEQLRDIVKTKGTVQKKSKKPKDPRVNRPTSGMVPDDTNRTSSRLHAEQISIDVMPSDDTPAKTPTAEGTPRTKSAGNVLVIARSPSTSDTPTAYTAYSNLTASAKDDSTSESEQIDSTTAVSPDRVESESLVATARIDVIKRALGRDKDRRSSPSSDAVVTAVLASNSEEGGEGREYAQSGKVGRRGGGRRRVDISRPASVPDQHIQDTKVPEKKPQKDVKTRSKALVKFKFHLWILTNIIGCLF